MRRVGRRWPEMEPLVGAAPNTAARVRCQPSERAYQDREIPLTSPLSMDAANTVLNAFTTLARATFFWSSSAPLVVRPSARA